MGRIPAWGWLVLLLVAGFAVLIVSDFMNNKNDTAWLDPKQPPPMVPLAVQLPGGRPCRDGYARDYPGSLCDWDGTVVGDV